MGLKRRRKVRRSQSQIRALMTASVDSQRRTANGVVEDF
jgi:hypothetical protein